MKLEHYPVEKLKKEILEIVRKYLDLNSYQVFFFGSRIQGEGGERADIDVGIEGPSPTTFEKLLQIKEEIDKLPILYKIDVIDFKRVSDDFREVALKHTELITPA